jgi:putative component of membrane protein insertase Oxa1/YidC/SpoIIIJ protein YidD
MKTVLIALIAVYQRVAPKTLRNRCIFAESCSDFVIRNIREYGVSGGFAALLRRMRCCRPGYISLPPSSMYSGINFPVRLADGSIVDRSILSSRVQL